MKKVIGLLCMLVFIGMAFGVDFNFERSLNLGENEGIVSLGKMTVNLGAETVSKFTIVIPNTTDDYFIFENNPSELQIVGKTFTTSIRSDYKMISFVGTFSGSFDISGIKIRTYDQRIYSSKIGLDYTGDSSVDVSSTNIIDLTEDNRYSDNMRPLPVTNVSYTVNGNTIKFFWIKSPDLDVYTNIIRVNKNGYFVKDYFDMTSGSSINDLDLANNDYKIEIFSKDYYYMGDPVTLNIAKSTPQTPVTTTTTGTTTPTTTTDTAKYTPTLKSAVLSFIATKLDANITKYSTEAASMNQRNLFIKFLENFLSKKLSVNQFNSQLVNHAEMLKMFKK